MSSIHTPALEQEFLSFEDNFHGQDDADHNHRDHHHHHHKNAPEAQSHLPLQHPLHRH